MRSALDCAACRIGRGATTVQTFDECRHDHVQAVLVSPAHELVSVDIHMVEPVTALWAHGVMTTASCEGYGYLEWAQGDGSRPYIQLDRSADADVALALHVLHRLTRTNKWAVEPPANDWNICLVPAWAAQMATERIRKRAEVSS